ncbi:MAG: hypothetical protein Q4B81_05960 [Moraxella sp.]|nr:hypothetical protein [Moraxella sp.]
METINFNHQKLNKLHKQILSKRLEIFAKDKNKGKPYKIALSDIRAKLKTPPKCVADNEPN